MKTSRYLIQAKRLLDGVKERLLSPEQRRELAVELAGLLLHEARRVERNSEKKQQKLLARMMNDLNGKAFFTHATDQCFRCSSYFRAADQLAFLLRKFGIPKFLPPLRKCALFLFPPCRQAPCVPRCPSF